MQFSGKGVLSAVFLAALSVAAEGGNRPEYTPKSSGRVRFALCQTPAKMEDGTNGVNRIFRWVRKRAGGNVDVFVLPELAFASFLKLEGAWILADAVWQGTAAFAREADAWVVVNHPVRTEGGAIYSETRVFSPGGEVITTYRKRILARMDQRASFSPGDSVRLAELPFAKLGFLICKDAFYPDVGSEPYADADVLVVQFAHPGVDDEAVPEARFYPPTAGALAELRGSSAGWRRFEKPFLAVNKAGRDGPYNLVGGSHAADASGLITAEIGQAPGLLLVDFPLDSNGRIGP